MGMPTEPPVLLGMITLKDFALSYVCLQVIMLPLMEHDILVSPTPVTDVFQSFN